ncbi:MAG: DNA primase [Candidatus Saccharimonadales bacterium]
MDAVDEIKQRLSIEDVVGEYVELKRAGRNWKGLSPFSSERTPSFMVSPEKQIWHDFSSGKGGSMFSFIMEMEGVDFRGSLEILARKAGIDLDQFRGGNPAGRGREKERLHEALELATHFYQMHLKKSQIALDYLKKRQFTGKTIIEWRVGYSPNNGTALIDFLKSKKFTDDEIKSAGLSAQRYRGIGDMFRGRLMIPLADAQGRIIGFTARLLADDPNAPKYINTPQTMLYDKSRHVYGLHLAKEMIRRSKFVVVAEGNLDVIMSHQAGVRQVVATAGTALTESHLKALSRFTGDIRLSFDADKAGLAATERAIPIASKVDVSLSVITIPSGKDPDELIKQDPAAWEQAITKHEYALDWLIKRYTAELDITTAQGKRELSDIVLAVVRRLGDRVEQEHYIEHISALLSVSREALTDKLHQKEISEKPRLKKPSAAPVVPDKHIIDYMRTQNHLLSLALLQISLRPMLKPVTQDMLMGDDAKALHTFLHEHPAFDGSPQEAADLKPIADYVKILSLHYEELYENVDGEELQYEATRLQTKLIDQYVKIQKQRLMHELQSASEAETEVLLEQAKHLDALLKTYNGGA